MKRMIMTLALTVALVLSLAAPAMAATGREYGQHHSEHAREMGGFTGDHNPGVHHEGFSGWMGHHEG